MLRRQLAPAPRVQAANCVRIDDAEVDQRLGGGLVRAACHEVFAQSLDDASAAAAFALLVALLAEAEQPLIWVREDRACRRLGALYPPGLIELGIDPARVLTVNAPDTLAVLRAGADITRCGAVGAVVIEPAGKAPALDLTASRRLAMAAAQSGVTTIVLRIDATPMASAAHTRWSVASAPSRALAADAPGHPAFDLELLRHRGGLPGFSTRLEWNRDLRRFASLSRGVPAAPPLRTDRRAA